MERPSNQYSENMQNFLKYIFERFSDNFSKNELEHIWNRIWREGLEKYLEEVRAYREKTKRFDFEKMYNKLLPNKKKSQRHIRKMKSLLWYMVNFWVKQEERETKNEKEIEKTQKEIIENLNTNDTIVEYLVKNFCNISTTRAFKFYFAKKYKENNNSDSSERLRSCIREICKEASKKLNPEDTIEIEKWKIILKNRDEEIIKKYDNFLISDNEEAKNAIYQGYFDNTIEDILISFFKDHKLESYGSKKHITEDETKNNINDLFDK